MRIIKRFNALKPLASVASLSAVCLLLALSCTKKVGTEPKPTTVAQCDTISYARDIAPIIEKNCSIAGCHVQPNPSAGVMLNTYDLLKAKGEGGRIKARVIDQIPTPMPPAGLTADEKKLIECWLENGYKP
ncbi:MAG: hypothetical protein MUF75_09150 [Bacteroidia bacterium]|jgi:uncharacterized membrane protein|nr:hypothetical protein [Bacteroidia bacterium]